MTTIAVVQKDGCAAIAADTLTTYGYAKETAEYIANSNKIFTVGNSYLAVSGPHEGRLALRYFFRHLKTDPTLKDVDEIYAVWLQVHKSLREDHFLRPEEEEDDSFESTRIETLIVNPYGIFGVGPYRSVQQFTRFHAEGSGRAYAMGAMYVSYDDPNLSAEEIARLAVNASAEFDESTGLPMISYSVLIA